MKHPQIINFESLNHKSLLLVLIIFSLIFRFFIILDVPIWGWDERLYVENALEYYNGNGASSHASLYSYILQFAFLAEQNYFTAIKLINVLILSLGLISVYWLARLFISTEKSMLVVLLSSIIGHHSITSHAMTEPLLFLILSSLLFASCSLWLLFWEKIKRADAQHGYVSPDYRKFIVTFLLVGVLPPLAIATSPKFYSVLTIMALTLFLLMCWFFYKLGSREIIGVIGKWWLKGGAIAIGAFILISTILNIYVYKGGGDFYHNLTSQVTLEVFFEQLYTQPILILNMFIGHLGTIMFPFVFAIIATILWLFERIRNKDGAIIGCILICFMVLIILFAQTFYFTVTKGKYENITWTVFARYYYFALPFLLIGLMAVSGDKKFPKAVSLFVGLIILSAALYTSHSGYSTISQYGGIENAETWSRKAPDLHLGLIITSLALLFLSLVVKWAHIRIMVIPLFIFHNTISSLSQPHDLGAWQQQQPTQCSDLESIYDHKYNSFGLISFSRVLKERTLITNYPFNISLVVDFYDTEFLDSLAENGGFLSKLPEEDIKKFKKFDIILVEDFPKPFPEQDGLLHNHEQCSAILSSAIKD